MTVTFTLTEEDYIRFHHHFIATSPQMKNQIRMIRMILPVILVILGLFLYARFRASDFALLPLLVCVLLAYLWARLFPAMIHRSVEKQDRKMFRTRGEDLLGETTMYLADGKIRYATGGQDLEVACDAIGRIVHDGEITYLYTGEAHALLVPDRAFAAEGEKDAFLEAIRQRQNSGNSSDCEDETAKGMGTS